MTAADAYFELTAHEYDERTLRAHPCYQEMLAQVAFALPEQAGDILELGCGTGALTGTVAERYPSARIRDGCMHSHTAHRTRGRR